MQWTSEDATLLRLGNSRRCPRLCYLVVQIKTTNAQCMCRRVSILHSRLAWAASIFPIKATFESPGKVIRFAIHVKSVTPPNKYRQSQNWIGKKFTSTAPVVCWPLLIFGTDFWHTFKIRLFVCPLHPWTGIWHSMTPVGSQQFELQVRHLCAVDCCVLNTTS